MSEKILVPDIGDFENVEVIEVLVKPRFNENLYNFNIFKITDVRYKYFFTHF